MGLAPYGEPRFADLIREAPDPHQGRRLVLDGPELFQLLRRHDDDEREVPPAVRRAAARSRSRWSRSARWISRRRCRSCARRSCSKCARHVHKLTGVEEPRDGRRRGAQLRGQRQDSARRTVREHLDPAGRGRCRRRARRRAAHLASRALAAAHGRQQRDSLHGSLLGPRFTRRGDPRVPRLSWREVSRARRARTELLDRVSSTCSRRRRSSAGCRTGWNSARARSGPARIIGDPRSTKMQQVMNLKIKFRESFRPVRAVGAARAQRASISTCRTHVDSPYMLHRGAGAARTQRVAGQHGADERAGRHREAQRAALDRAGDHARRFLRARPDGDAGGQRPLLPAHQAVLRAHRLPGAGEHQLQHPRRADRLHAARTPIAASWARTWTRWCWRIRCC